MVSFATNESGSRLALHFFPPCSVRGANVLKQPVLLHDPYFSSILILNSKWQHHNSSIKMHSSRNSRNRSPVGAWRTRVLEILWHSLSSTTCPSTYGPLNFASSGQLRQPDPSPFFQTINKVLRDNSDNTGAQYLWLADTYDSLHDYDGLTHEGTSSPIDPAWRSPFVGKTPADAIAFIRNAPKPPKPLCKAYCALLQKALYEEKGYLLMCKAIEGKRDPETIPVEGKEAGLFFVAFEREEWDECHQKQKLMEP